MIIDAHIHCTGLETADDILRALDESEIDVGVLLAPFWGAGGRDDDPDFLRRANAHLARLIRGHEQRLVGLAVVDPGAPTAPRDLRYAIEDLGLTGAKMLPSGWHPHDELVQPAFAVASDLRLPLLFHCGIFINGDTGQFCRPSCFEILRSHPGIRITLAHLGWPWTDEAIAVGVIDRIHGVPPADIKFRFDISFGPPPPYRREALVKALEVLGPDLLQFGSDCVLPCPGGHFAERRRRFSEMLDELEVTPEARQSIWGETAATWLGLPRIS